MSAVLFNFAGIGSGGGAGSAGNIACRKSVFARSFATCTVICHFKDVSGTILWRKESDRSKNGRNESDGSGFWNKRTEKVRDLLPNSLMKKQRYGTAAGNLGKRTPTFQESTMVSEINIHA